MSPRSIAIKALKEPSGLIELYSCHKCTFKWALLTGTESYKLAKNREMVIACLKGRCDVDVDGASIEIGCRDTLYLSGPSELKLYSNECLVVVAEAVAKSKGLSIIRRFVEIQPVITGMQGYRRKVYVAIGEKDPSCSLLAGYTEGFPGEWTSFPPHKHDDKLEVYVYYGLEDGFGVQIVEDENNADLYMVKNYDAVVICRGYHPNVGSPGVGINYLWILCQVEGEKNMRVDFKPGYDRFQLGSTHLRS
ncbi:MAG: 5-deoxy-glucuronate isomerase [Thermofilaceae archaeon]